MYGPSISICFSWLKSVSCSAPNSMVRSFSVVFSVGLFVPKVSVRILPNIGFVKQKRCKGIWAFCSFNLIMCKHKRKSSFYRFWAKNVNFLIVSVHVNFYSVSWVIITRYWSSILLRLSSNGLSLSKQRSALYKGDRKWGQSYNQAVEPSKKITSIPSQEESCKLGILYEHSKYCEELITF